jgi:hypothetical protein
MLTKENKNGLASLLDDMIKFNNPMLEAIDGATLKVVLGIIDDKLLNKIPEALWEDINQTIAEIIKKDYEQAIIELGELIAKILNEYILPANLKDNPPIDDDVEIPNIDVTP